MDAAPAQVSTEEPGEPAGTRPDGALHDLYARHAGAVHSRVRRMLRDHEHAEDVVQETLARAWRNLDQMPPGEDGARRWLLRVARNLAIDHMRARRARPVEVAESAGRDTTTADHSEAVIDTVYVQRTLSRLSPDHRAVLTEVYLNGRTAQEAAAILNVPVGTVKSRVFYALRLLRTQLHPTHANPF
jgi:RNA polymerase sigma-70 factor (ECF subfamily)